MTFDHLCNYFDKILSRELEEYFQESNTAFDTFNQFYFGYNFFTNFEDLKTDASCEHLQKLHYVKEA